MKGVMDKGLELLEQQESFVMAMVINQSGSTPRNMGVKMIIRRNEESIGTIGGGLVEAHTQNLAKKVFENRQSIIKRFALDKKDVAEMDMICGGRVIVYLKYIDGKNQYYREVYSEVYNTKVKQKKGWFITLLSEASECKRSGQWFLTEDKILKGEPLEELEANEIKEFCSNAKKIHIFVSKNNNKYLIEYMGHIDKAYIYGAGHVGHKLAPLLSYVGFYTVVLDDRGKYANKDRFPMANEVIVLDSFDNVFENINIDRNTYIIIVTRGHQYDQTVLEQALNTDAAYIGMMGSIKKRNQIYNNLLEKGFEMKELNEVSAPIGLPIRGETPEEIAISIVAELVDIRAKKTDEIV
ncbi:XdhC family aldehyde oxidoreductase maturation factor [Clostridiisalibacter paucivorans]|uniref:XdhC family aldehyde oxidoreductase maturation factor n=1 Tax=Clostridiisalibacter paucivorans TaxID=408753 RepID=UPI0004792172|nr:XdhC/CoxI family protein [Clostridiisalibacter paucivorans]